MQQRYDQALRYQAAHQLAEAAEQYRVFLADSLGEIAIGLAHAHLFQKAFDNFDEALRLVADFPMLRLQYARASLEAGNLTHAQTEAEQVLRSHTATSQAAAGAHEVLGRVLLKKEHLAEAKQELEKAVSLSATFENGYDLAIVDIDMGNAKAASAIFAEMIRSYGDQAVLHLYFGRAFGSSDFQAESRAEFEKALALDPKLPGVHYGLAAAFLTGDEGHLGEAESELRKEIAISPDDAAAYAALGHLLSSHADDAAAMQEAEKDLERATTLDAQSPDAFLFLAQFNADTNRPEEAVPLLQRSIALTTDPARNGYQVQKAHYLLGRLLLKSGQADEGKKELAASEALVQLKLHHDQTRLSDYLNADQSHESTMAPPGVTTEVLSAITAADRAKRVEALQAQLTPAIADSYNNLGAIAAGQSDFRAAVLAFQRAAEWNPQLPGLDYNWGRAAFAAGLVSEASGPLRRYLRSNPQDSGARAVLGLCLFTDRQFTEARDTLEPLQGKPETPTQVQFAYADSLIESGRVSKGTAQLEQLAQAHPDVLEVHEALGKAYAEAQSPKAVAEYEAAIRIKPDDVKAQEALAKLDLQAGKVDEAVAHLELALAAHPANAALQQELANARQRLRAR